MPIVYGPSLPPIPNGLTPAAIAILREQLDEDTLQTLLSYIQGRVVTTVTPEDFGAKGDGRADDLAALNSATAAVVAAGGGYVSLSPNKIYRITSEWQIGPRFVAPDDIVQGCNFSTAPSFDSIKYAAAATFPAVSVLGNGATIWGDFASSSTGVPIVSYSIREVHTRANQDNFGVTGLVVVGQEGYISGSPPTANFSGSAAAFPSGNKQVGFFSVNSPVKLQLFAAREVRRGVVLCDCYSSRRADITASHCVDGLTFINDNGGVAFNLKSTLCRGIGLSASGQTFTYMGFISEQNAVDIYVPSCDGGTIIEPYLENTTSGDTDWGVKLGDTANAAASQVINFRVVGGHLYKQYGSSIRFHSTVYTKFDGFRSYTTGASINNNLCAVLIEGYLMDFAAGAGYVPAAVTQFCPGQPGGTLQLAGVSGADALKLIQGARLALGGGPYLYSDGSRVITLAGAYVGGTFETAGSSFFQAMNGPGSTTAWLFQNNTTDGASALAFDFAASSALANAAALIAKWRSAGSTRMSLYGLGDLELNTVSAGLILKSPDGTRYKLTVPNGGASVTITAA